MVLLKCIYRKKLGSVSKDQPPKSGTSPEGNPNKVPIMQTVPQNTISPRENHIFRTIYPNIHKPCLNRKTQPPQKYPKSTSLDLIERPSFLINTHPQLPPHPDYIPHLLMMPPNIFLHPPQPPLLPEIFSLPLLLHILLPSLSQPEIFFWPSGQKSPQVNTLW